MSDLISKETHRRFECGNCGSPQGNCVLFLTKACRKPCKCIYNEYIKSNWIEMKQEKCQNQ
jgi:hypothetical protein